LAVQFRINLASHPADGRVWCDGVLLRRVKRPACLALADSLVARGELLEAIDVLTTANREQRHPALEHRLLTLRCQGFHAADRGRSTPLPAPPAATNGLPRDGDLPEVPASALTVERLRGAIRARGALVVRGLIPEPTTRTLVATIDGLFAGGDAGWSA